MAYTKLFQSIVTSTIWREADETRIVWITMLALADKNGEVHASLPGLAHVAGVSLESCALAIEKFLAPDPHSRTKDDEGRRIQVIDGGWFVINHAKYRAMASRDEMRTATAIRQARFRDRHKRNGSVTHSNGSVTHHNATVTQDMHIADTDEVCVAVKPPDSGNIKGNYSRHGVAPTVAEVKLAAEKIGLPDWKAEEFWNYYDEVSWMRGKTKRTNWRTTLNTWKKNWEADGRPDAQTSRAGQFRSNGGHRRKDPNCPIQRCIDANPTKFLTGEEHEAINQQFRDEAARELAEAEKASKTETQTAQLVIETLR